MSPMAPTANQTLATRVVEACQTIATFTETPGNITRTYLSPPVHDTHHYLQAWMHRLGMESHIDAVGNLRGLHRCGTPNAPRLLLGSHIDTVPNAGAYDGVLGVVLALTLIEALAEPATESPAEDRLNYDIELAAFSEEEGVRFATPFIGSRALIGNIDETLLHKSDADGITLTQAVQAFGLDPSQIPEAIIAPRTFAFVEFHIEQGPVLEALNLSLGVVEAIAGQSRCQLTFHGKANHAGATPMHLRRDALAAAAEWVLAVEQRALSTPGLVATVGRITAAPGATNVIPGETTVTLDIRHATDSIRLTALDELLARAQSIASSRSLRLDAIRQLDQPAVPMNPTLASALEAAAIAIGHPPHRMVSGAGHDAMVLAAKVPAAMLFLRSPGGISHHPDESVLIEDVKAALDAGLYFLKHLDAAAFSPSE